MTFTEPLRCREGWRLRHGPVCNGCRFSLTHSLFVLLFESVGQSRSLDCFIVVFNGLDVH